MILFNENKEIPIIKESGAVSMIHGSFKREKYETIGTFFSDDVIKVLKSLDKKKFKEDSLLTISGIKLSNDLSYNSENGLVTEVWVYYINYSIYLGGILGGGNFYIDKSEFDQNLRDIKLNNLLD